MQPFDGRAANDRPFARLTAEEAEAICCKCSRLMDEGSAVPWWNWWRYRAINREVRVLLDSLKDGL